MVESAKTPYATGIVRETESWIQSFYIFIFDQMWGKTNHIDFAE